MALLEWKMPVETKESLDNLWFLGKKTILNIYKLGVNSKSEIPLEAKSLL